MNNGLNFDNILTTFYMHLNVSKCIKMYFHKINKTLKNIEKINVFKGFVVGGEGEI